MPYPGSSYVLDLPALLPRVSHANIIKFFLTSIFQASLLYSSNPPSAHPGRLLLKSTYTSHSLKSATITMLANAPSSLSTQPPIGRSPLGILKLTHLNNFRIHLLVGCDGLEADAARFRSRTTSAQPGDPSCKLCNQGVPEDAAHFVSTCPVFDQERVKLYSEAPPTVHSQIPHPRVHLQDFLEVMTGTCWVDDINIQKFCIHFLSKLKAARTALLFPDLS